MCCILERGLELSPFNFHMKIVLLQTYCAMGACAPATHLYNELQIKQIQLDSLSWVMLDAFNSLCFFGEAERANLDVCGMHSKNTRDSGDYIIKAYQCGNLSKVLEMNEFHQNRMQKSLQLRCSQVDIVSLGLLSQSRSFKEAEAYMNALGNQDTRRANASLAMVTDEEIASLSQNHDFTIAISWDCTASPNSGSYIAPFAINSCRDKEQVGQWLRVGMLGPRLLHKCMLGNVSDAKEELAKYSTAMDDLSMLSEEAGAARAKCWLLNKGTFEACVEIMQAAAGDASAER